MSTSLKLAARCWAQSLLLGLSVTCCSAFAASDKCEILLAIIQSPDSSENEKATALEDLAAVGDSSSIEPLAQLLRNPQWSHYARYALQANPDPAAGAALRNSLDTLEGESKIGVINSLASRGDQQSVGKLAELLSSENSDCAVAAAGALATLGTASALDELKSSPADKTPLFADALLEAALVYDKSNDPANAEAMLNRVIEADTPDHVKQAATLALVRVARHEKSQSLVASLLASQEEWKFEAGLQAAVDADPSECAQALSNAFSSSSQDRQVKLLSALETKTSGVSLDVVRSACSSQDASVRIAACSALGILGDKTDGLLLVSKVLEDPDAADAATQALVKLSDPHVNEFLTTLLSSSERPEQALGAKLIGLRYIHAASPELFEMARSSDSQAVRLAALGALLRIAPASSLDEVLELVRLAQSTEEEQVARSVAIEVATRATNQGSAVATVAHRLESWPVSKQGLLLDVLAQIGGSEALEVVAAAAQSPDRQTQDHATRVLGNWPTSDAAPVLLRLASSDNEFAIRALRGYLRIARQFPDGEKQRLNMCREALTIAKRDQERMLALQIAALSPSSESLDLAVSQLSADALGSKAGEIVLTIAEAVAPTNPAAAAEAAQHVIAAGPNESVVVRAQKLLNP